jgi:hypothetical protein
MLNGEVREKLEAMELNPLLNTRTTSYSANAKLYPDGQMPFVEKHLTYLLNHPKLDPQQYLANLRLMLKRR